MIHGIVSSRPRFITYRCRIWHHVHLILTSLQCRCKVALDVIVDIVVGFFFYLKKTIENNMIFFKGLFHTLHLLKTTPLRNFPFFLAKF